jgi:predicted TIM-barrel fold metal-dependent hydrolase
VALRDEPGEVALRAAEVLDRGAIGIVVSAGALGSRAGVHRLGALLALLEDRMCPLFVHPGPGTAAAAPAAAGPAWWAPATTYVAQLHAAWHAVAAWARPDFPRLHVVFAALAGLAPLHAERTALRGGPALDELDARTFYDASSYGPRALRAMAAQVGTAQLVHGTDVPVVPGPTTRPLGHEVHERMRRENAARLLGRLWVAA